MIDFIYMGLVELRGPQNNRKLQNEKTLIIAGFDPKHSGPESFKDKKEEI